jgi:hypothetical protein
LYTPSIVVALLILFSAALLGNFLASVVRGATGSEMLASIARYAVLVYAVFAAITQLGIAVELMVPTFLILLGAIALALAIAFGIGGREVARDILEKAYNKRQQLINRSTGHYGTTGRVQGERPEVHRLPREE